MSGLESGIGAVLGRFVRVVLRFPKTTIALMLALAAASIAYAAANLGVNTDSANMISASLPWRQDFIDYRDSFPARDRNLVVVIDAPSAARADAFAAAFLAELAADPDLYRSVFMQGEGEFFERNGLLYLPMPELEQLADRLTSAQPLLGVLGQRFDGAAVLELAARASTAPSAAVDSAALDSLLAELTATLDAASAGEARTLEWRSLLGTERGGGMRRVVVLQPRLHFDTLQPASDALAGIREIAARLGAVEPGARVRITGSVAMEHDELLSVSRGAGLAALATILLVAFVLYAALRSWRLLAISVVTLMCGLGITAAFAAAAVGHLNLLSVAFVVLNVGLGSDYVIHVSLRYKELVQRGEAVDTALLDTMRGVGSSLVLCAVTTAAGFYSFIPTSFVGVSELGLIAGTGVFFSLLASVTLMPAAIAVFGRSDGRAAVPGWITARPFAAANRRPRTVLGVSAVALVITFAALPWVRFDNNPINLRDPASESVATLRELAADGEAPLLNLAAIAPDSATAQRWAAELAVLPEVRMVITPDTLVPRDQAAKIALLEDLSLLLGPDFGELERAPADPERLVSALEALARSSAGSPPAVALADSAAQLRMALAALPREARHARLLTLDESLTGRLAVDLRRLAAGLTAMPFAREDLPAVLGERWVAADGRELIEIVPAQDASENAAAARFIDAVRSVVPTATGLPVVYEEASATVVGAFRQALAYALLMVAGIIWLVLRRPADVLLVIAPIVAAAGATAGLTVLLGIPFNYANIIALPLIVGIGVDNGIHVVHRMRLDGGAATLFETSTMRAVLASGLTTVASFGNLAFSSHVGTSSMGKLLAIGLAASMAATLIMLPACLKVLAGRGAPRAAAQ